MATSATAEGKSYYNTVRNSFGGLNVQSVMMMYGCFKDIVDNSLVEENSTLETAITLDTMDIKSTEYRYQLRVANLNNKQGKTLKLKDTRTGTSRKITSPEWGVVFNSDEQGNYCAVVLSCDNSSPYNDITDQRTMQVKVIQCRGDETEVLAQSTLSKGISLEDDLNTICVDVDEHGVKVSIGKDELAQVLEVNTKRPNREVHVGYLTGPGSRVAIERAVLTISNEKQIAAVTTSWNRTRLNEYFEQSADPIEGYWSYLDRDMQDEWMRLGGRYTLAVVRNGNGYDLIYIDGAQVKKSFWQEGMLKGHLTKTMFSGNYDMYWIDATMEPIDKDAYATIENGVILTLNFPVFKSQVRFAKIIEIDD